jgi:prephenate dehydratase
MHQEEKYVVAFQGERGAYSEQAIRDHFGEESISLPCHSFGDIFDAMHAACGEFFGRHSHPGLRSAR